MNFKVLGVKSSMIICLLVFFLLDSISLGMMDSQRRGSVTPQPQRAASASSGLSQRSQSFDRLDDPLIYSEIPSFSNSYSESPLVSNSSIVSPLVHNSTPPPPIGYNSAPPPPPPPVHKATQPSMPHKEVEVYPEGPPSPFPPSMADVRRNSATDWHSDLKEKLRKRAESVGNFSPKRPSTPLDDQMYVEVVPPSYTPAQHQALPTSPPAVSIHQGTPPVTPPMKKSQTHLPPPCPPKPSKTNVVSSHDRNSDEDDAINDSPFAKALKAAKLKRAVTNDRSSPRV